jgi:hypothetical protein
MSIFSALGTGMRRGDIESLRVSDSHFDETFFLYENWVNIAIAAAWSGAYNCFSAMFVFSCVRCFRRSLRALYERECVAGNANERSQGTKQQAF